jgi:predicted TIM-barrel fold metal-dependent hydrolase
VTAEIVDVNTLFGFWPKRKADISLNALLSLLREKRIAHACTLSARGIFYDFVAGNTETLDACQTHPQLIPTGTLNPVRWIGCREEAQRLMDLGVRMFRFFPQYQEWHIGQAPFRKLLEEVLAPSQVALMLPADLGISAIGEMAKHIPNPVIVEAFRYDKLAEAIVVMQEVPNVFVETHLINSPNFLELLRLEVGLERVLYGSYAPLAYAGAALAPIQHARVPDEDKALILGGNLRRILAVSV